MLSMYNRGVDTGRLPETAQAPFDYLQVCTVFVFFSIQIFSQIRLQAYAPHHESDDRYIPTTFMDSGPGMHGSLLHSRISSACSDSIVCVENYVSNYGSQNQNAARPLHAPNQTQIPANFNNSVDYCLINSSSRSVYSTSTNSLEDPYLSLINNSNWHGAQNCLAGSLSTTDHWPSNQIPRFQQGQSMGLNHSLRHDSDSCFPSASQSLTQPRLVHG